MPALVRVSTMRTSRFCESQGELSSEKKLLSEELQGLPFRKRKQRWRKFQFLSPMSSKSSRGRANLRPLANNPEEFPRPQQSEGGGGGVEGVGSGGKLGLKLSCHESPDPLGGTCWHSPFQCLSCSQEWCIT